jgi:HK97 family phage portal protein
MSILDFFKQPEQRFATYSIADPEFRTLVAGTKSASGAVVTETSALGFPAVWRSVEIIAGTIAILPLKSYRTAADGSRERIRTFLDSPGGPNGLTPFEWTELVIVHLLLHGNAYLRHLYNNAGALVALEPIHPLAVTPKLENGQKVFIVAMEDGSQRTFTPQDITHIMDRSVNGLYGLSRLTIFRNTIGAGLSADEAAASMYANALRISGMVSPDASAKEKLTKEQALDIKSKTINKWKGSVHAGEVVVAPIPLNFQPWTLAPKDAEFLASRAFNIEDIARIYGVPPHLLAQTEKQTSWGTGLEEQNRGLARYTLGRYTTNIEQKLSRLIRSPRFVEFDYAALLQPSEKEVSENLAVEIASGFRTINEARRIKNLPPLSDEELAALANRPTPKGDLNVDG